MNDIRVSVIVNNYNYGVFLELAIESILQQTYKNIELIVVDDGSTDNSINILEKYKGKIVSVFKKNGGQASALNEGWKISKGELVIFLDADDYLLENAVSRIVDTYQKNKRDITKIQYLLKVLLRGELKSEYYPAKKFSGKTEDYKNLVMNSLWYQSPPTSGNAFTREYLNQIMPIPEMEFKISADSYLIIPTPLLGEVISINECLGVYRIHGKNNWAHKGMSLEKLKPSYERILAGICVLNRFSGQIKNEMNFFEIWRYKIVLVKLGELKNENVISVVFSGMITLIRDKGHTLLKKIICLLWFLLVAMLPVKNQKCQKIIFKYWWIRI